MNHKKLLALFTILLLLVGLVVTCTKKPNEPVNDNPFDPKYNAGGDDIPPIIRLNVQPDSGITNETLFTFDASGSYENDLKSLELLYRWDIGNDGNFENNWSKEAIFSDTFKTGGGNKPIKLEIMGLKRLISDTVFSVFVNTRPVAQFTFSHDSANPQIIHFDASASYDYEDGSNLEYRWDFDNDGAFETRWLTLDTISYVFKHIGIYQTRLIVRDKKQLISQKTSEITVQLFIDMIFVQGGTFQMGDTWGDGDSDEKPVHTVTLNSFYIGKYEVTQAQYREIMENNPSYFKGDNRPVERISWYDAVRFCNKLSESEELEPCYIINGSKVTCDFTKNGYRLPTEAEWEYAARGGSLSHGYKYSGNNNVEDVAWYNNNSGGYTHEVGTKQANELGIYDMSGNVWEWCWDWYAQDYYNNSPQYNPKGPNSGSHRVIRGGKWNDEFKNVRNANRGNGAPSVSYGGVGFRVVRSY